MPNKAIPAKGCKDVFHAGLVSGAHFSGKLEMPSIPRTTVEEKPKELVRFSDSIGASNQSAVVHFYEHDCKIERVWHSPNTYLPSLKQYKAVITPDFSLYRDMPLVMQAWNTYRGRVIGYWLQKNGVTAIPNVRWGDERTFDFCFDGIARDGILAVGSHGCMKRTTDKQYFMRGLKEMVTRLSPHTIIVYGTAPVSAFQCCIDAGIKVWQYDSVFRESHRREVC